MTKRELIDEILTINRSAEPGFLAKFGDADLNDYLAHLRMLNVPRMTGDSSRYAKYFATTATAPSQPAVANRPLTVVATDLDLLGPDVPPHVIHIAPPADAGLDDQDDAGDYIAEFAEPCPERSDDTCEPQSRQDQGDGCYEPAQTVAAGNRDADDPWLF